LNRPTRFTLYLLPPTISTQTGEYPKQDIDLKDIPLHAAFPDASLNGMLPIIESTRWVCGTQDAQLALHNSAYGSLLLPNEPIIAVKQATSTSGARYLATDRSKTEFLAQGKRGQLIFKGQTYPECILQGAAMSFPFTAFGNEPNWALTINPKINTLRFSENGTETQQSYQQTDASALSNTYSSDGQTQAISATVTSQTCTDGMSGMNYPFSVTVQKGTEIFKGCGGEPSTATHP
jgi:uncharacterized membrane protein